LFSRLWNNEDNLNEEQCKTHQLISFQYSLGNDGIVGERKF